jgi:predicted enzyme related to lactoylglutathione lyase
MKILKTLVRVYAHDPDTAIRFYESLTGTRAVSRFSMPGAGLELAVVSDVLIICGTDEALRQFRQTDGTFLVDSLEEFHRFLVAHGATVLSPPQRVPTGINMTVRHPDGSVFEYVEHHKPLPA